MRTASTAAREATTLGVTQETGPRWQPEVRAWGGRR